MLKTSYQPLSLAFLSASLLLATASSAQAQSKITALEIKSAALETKKTATESKSTTVETQNAGEKKASLAYLQAKTLQAQTLQGTITSAAALTVRPPVLYLDDLVESALHISQSGLSPNTSSAQNTSTLHNLGRSAKTFVPNYFDYRPSRAAAQAFLGNESRANKNNNNSAANAVIKSTGSSETTDKSAESVEKLEDERHQRNKLALSLTAAMMQIAKGLGDSDSKVAEASLERGRSKISELIGKGQADWVITRMSSWAEQVKGHYAENCGLNSGNEADVIEQEDQVSALVARAITRDPQINNIKASIAVHDQAPTGAERSLTLASLTPNLIGPAAKLAQLAVERGSGGSRSKRLEDVLTLGLAMQERINFLTRESELAVNNLEKARSTKNDVLYVFSKDLISKIGGP